MAIKIKKAPIYSVLFFILLLAFQPNPSQATDDKWLELKGEHFIVFTPGPENFKNSSLAKETLEKAEKYYKSIAFDLDSASSGNFWTWDNRIKIYLYPQKELYLKATGQPDWSEGMADKKTKEIASFIGSRKFLESVLPHEITHLIFENMLGGENTVPRWLDEGVAQWEEDLTTQHDFQKKARDLFQNDSLLSLKDIFRINIKYFNKEDKKIFFRTVHTQDDHLGLLVLSSNNLIDSYYIESASIVGFLKGSYGTEHFLQFCHELQNGKTFEESLILAYPEYIKTVEELEDKWRAYLAAQLEDQKEKKDSKLEGGVYANKNIQDKKP
jgi:hypothetical protein